MLHICAVYRNHNNTDPVNHGTIRYSARKDVELVRNTTLPLSQGKHTDDVIACRWTNII